MQPGSPSGIGSYRERAGVLEDLILGSDRICRMPGAKLLPTLNLVVNPCDRWGRQGNRHYGRGVTLGAAAMSRTFL